jgi:hypothetical protein
MNTFEVPVQEPSYAAGGMQDLKKRKETIEQKKITWYSFYITFKLSNYYDRIHDKVRTIGIHKSNLPIEIENDIIL